MSGEDRNDELWAIVRNGLQQIVSEIDERLNKKADVIAQVINKSYDQNKLLWTPASGAKGPFEIAKGGADFEALKADLHAHRGGMRIGEFWIWLFPDGAAIGRKVQGKT